MRPIILKYAGECRKCSAALDVGAQAVYERRVGVFCPDCAPTDTEEIREYRQEGADRKADRLDGWAAKREAKASAALNTHPEIRRDWAFITQPGHIPLRAKMNAADDRAYESLSKAGDMRRKANSLRHVRVAGDREQERQAIRGYIRSRLRVGMKVETAHYGRGVVEKINKKTATIGSTGISGTYKMRVDLSFIRIPNDGEPTDPRLTSAQVLDGVLADLGGV